MAAEQITSNSASPEQEADEFEASYQAKTYVRKQFAHCMMAMALRPQMQHHYDVLRTDISGRCAAGPEIGALLEIDLKVEKRARKLLSNILRDDIGHDRKDTIIQLCQEFAAAMRECS